MTRPRRGEPRARTKIIEASRKLFARRGFSETSMGDIARAAQVARATVYNNFDDKQDILAAIISDYMTGYARIAQRLRENARSGQTSFELIQEMVREALGWRVKNADLRPIVAVARNLRGSGWEEANKAADDALISWIMAVHAADEDAGLIRKDIDLEFGVRAAYNMIESILASFDVTASQEEIDEKAYQLALLHWYAICSVPPNEAPRSPLGRKNSLGEP
ncbi:MAG TPA: helix-turn-helix domain-containing protein [Solirubrobacterales bacterium]|nr:helix-turn-helix domain-containing protein [Solirubrobacterales bacterium]